MRHNVDSAVNRMVARYGIRKRRIKNRKFRIRKRAAKGALQVFFPIRYDGGTVHLRAGCSQRKNCSKRKRLLDYGFVCEETPYIALIRDACRNRFGCIDNAAAANGNNEIN